MHLVNFLGLCEQSLAKSVVTFRTLRFQGSLTIDAGNIIRMVGFDPAHLKEVLTEDLEEISITKAKPDFNTETMLPIKSMGGKSSSAPPPPPGNIVSSKSSFGKPIDPTAPPPPKKDLKNPPKNVESKKTLNVESTSQVPHIMLPFMMGRPEKKVIGRSEKCDIVVESYDVSRQHCEVVFCGKNLQVKDLDSSNGTFVNGKLVTESSVSSHDILRVGSIPFIVVIDVST